MTLTERLKTTFAKRQSDATSIYRTTLRAALSGRTSDLDGLIAAAAELGIGREDALADVAAAERADEIAKRLRNADKVEAEATAVANEAAAVFHRHAVLKRREEEIALVRLNKQKHADAQAKVHELRALRDELRRLRVERPRVFAAEAGR